MDRRKLLTGLGALLASTALPTSVLAKAPSASGATALSLDGTWAAGLDGGAITDMVYHVYMIRNAKGVADFVLSPSDKPTLPDGYRIVPSPFGGKSHGSFVRTLPTPTHPA